MSGPTSEHGVLGYRMAADGEILNVLRWTVGRGNGRDARRLMPARHLQPHPPFPSSVRPVPVVSKDEFGGTGFTAAHLGKLRDRATHVHRYRRSA